TATWDRPRTVLPEMMEKYKLMDKTPGNKPVDDAMLEKLVQTIFSSTADQAAEAAASALADGFDPAGIGEAVALTANQLILRDVGRIAQMEVPGKPIGSVHG